MRYFDMFAGVGGFSMGIERAYADISEASREESGRTASDSSSHERERLASEQPACIGLSETDKYASAVLKYRYPNVKNYGDCQKIDWSEVPDFDLLVGGSPCQDFSIAGKRAGLTGERSGLFREFLRALEEKKPRFFIWENVKGVLSSRGGWDFANIQAALAEAGYSLWWQVLNAKDFGVPQNRERVFIVGTRDGSSREVFFEPGADGQDTEPDQERDARVCPTIRATHHKRGDNQTVVAVRKNHGCVDETEDTSLNIDANYYKGLDNHGARTGILRWQNDRDGVVCDDTAPSLRASGGGGIRKKPAVSCVNPEVHQDYRIYEKEGVSPTLNSNRGGGSAKHPFVPEDARIRRLTPTECMRLMSWPDDHCDYGDFDGEVREISDTQKYKMAGNGVVSEVVRHVVAAHLLDREEQG